jgi:hypothetical protein
MKLSFEGLEMSTTSANVSHLPLADSQNGLRAVGERQTVRPDDFKS